MNLLCTITSLLLLVHLTTGIPAQALSDAACNEDQLRRCADNAAEPLRNSDLAVPSTLTAVRQVCSIWTDLTNCINDYTTRCMTPFQKLEFNTAMKSSMSSMSSLCGSESQQNEYLTHAPCLKKISTQENYCGKQYKFLIDHVAESTSIKQVCCARAKFMNCLQAKTPNGCGNRNAPTEKTQNSTRLSIAILDNSLAFLSQQCASSRFEASDCPGIEGTRSSLNSKGPLNNQQGSDMAASGETLGSQFQLNQGQKPAVGGSSKFPVGIKPSTGTKEIKEKIPITGQLSSKEQKPQTRPAEGRGTASRREGFLFTFVFLFGTLYALSM